MGEDNGVLHFGLVFFVRIVAYFAGEIVVPAFAMLGAWIRLSWTAINPSSSSFRPSDNVLVSHILV